MGDLLKMTMHDQQRDAANARAREPDVITVRDADGNVRRARFRTSGDGELVALGAVDVVLTLLD